jgi:hypothetical protein
MGARLDPGQTESAFWDISQKPKWALPSPAMLLETGHPTTRGRETRRPAALAGIGVASALNGHAEKLVQSRAPTKHNKQHYNNNHDGGQCEPPKSRPVQPTVGCSVSPATRWNIAGIIHPSFFKDFFDAEGASRAPVFELHAENIYVQPHLGPSRLVHQALIGLGASLLEEIRQFLPSISPISRHHKLAPPTEVVCARAPFRFVRA